jgi:hypothetical protein
LTCTSANTCETCPTNKFLGPQQLTCESYCPTGYVNQNNQCQAQANEILNIQLSKLNSSYTSGSGLSANLGSSDNATQAPNPIYNRGVLFDGVDDQISIQPSSSSDQALVLGPTQQAVMWIKPALDKTALTLIYKETGSVLVNFKLLPSKQLSLTLRLTDSTTGETSLKEFVGGSVDNDSWSQVSYSVAYSSSSGSTVTLYVNGQSVLSQVVANAYFKDPQPTSSSATLIGSSKNGETTEPFKGFIASVAFSSGSVATPQFSSDKCISSSFCLNNCAANQFSSGSSCANCLSSCTKGCVRSNDCTLSLDQLCANPKDYNECTTCKALAVLNSGKCECVPNASLNTSTGTCACNTDFKDSGNNACVTCKNYFLASEVTAAFNEDYRSFDVSFSRSVSGTASMSCTSIFSSETISKLGSNPSCRWNEKSKKLTVVLGGGSKIGNEKVTLNELLVVSSTGTCTYTAVALTPVVQYNKGTPLPVAEIKAPSSYSVGCSKGSLEFNGLTSRKGYGQSLSYKWTLKTSPSNQAVEALSSKDFSSDQGLLTISPALLSNFTLTATLEVKTWLNTTDSTSATVDVADASFLTVIIVGGSSRSTLRSEKFRTTAKIESKCKGESQVSYKWSLLSSNATSQRRLALDSSSSYILELSANSLEAGAQYKFMVEATQDSSKGSAILTLDVSKGALIATLDKSSGQISSAFDLQVSASDSKDPDNLPGSLAYAWTCAESTGSCQSALGGDLTFTKDSANLVVTKEQLRASATYSFTVVISKDTRSASLSLSLEVAGDIDATISLPSGKYRVNRERSYSVIVKVAGNSNMKLKWTQTSGPSASSDVPDDYSYIQFVPFSFTEGQEYNYKLEVSLNGKSLSSSLLFVVNQGPTGGSLAVSPTSGIAFSTVFQYTAQNWQDGDDSDLPLSYSYGFIDNKDRKRYLSFPLLSETYGTAMSSKVKSLVVSVCDSLWTCTLASVPVTVSKSRLLDTTASVSERFLTVYNKVTDPDTIPSLIDLYAQDVLAQADYDLLLSKLKTYTETAGELSDNRLQGAIGALQSLVENNPDLMYNSTLSDAVDYATELVNLSTVEMNTNDRQLLFDMFSSYLDRNVKKIDGFYKLLGRKQLSTKLPDATADLVKTASTFAYLQRVTAKALDNNSLVSLTTQVKFPALSMTGLKEEDCFDMLLITAQNGGEVGDTVEMVAESIGTYYNFVLAFNDERVEQKLQNSSADVNITFAVSSYDSSLNYSCAYKEDVDWISDQSCSVVSIDNSTVTVGTSHLTSFKVAASKSAEIDDPLIDIEDYDDSDPCGRNFATAAIACGIVVVMAAMLSQILLRKVVVSEEQHEENQPSHHVEAAPLASGDIHAQRADSGGLASEEAEVRGLVSDRRPANRALSAEEVELEALGGNRQPEKKVKPTKPLTLVFLQSHLTLAPFFAETKVLKAANMIGTCVTALLQLVILGILYLYIDNADETSDNKYEGREAFAEYSGDDFGYAVASVAICIPAAAVLVIMTMQKHQVVRNIGYVAAVGLSIASIIGIALLTSVMCSEYSALWAVGSFYGILFQVIVLQTLLALCSTVYAYNKVNA